MPNKSFESALGARGTWAFAAAANTPPCRVAMMREVFAKAFNTPQLWESARKFDSSYIDDAQAPGDFTAIPNQFPETLKEMSKYIKAGIWRGRDPTYVAIVRISRRNFVLCRKSIAQGKLET